MRRTGLYVRRVVHKGDEKHYVLRKTYRKDGTWKYRDLVDLGPDPAGMISESGGADFYYRLEEELDALGESYSLEDFEDVFMPYFHPRIRSAYERSHRRSYFPYALSNSCTPSELSSYQEELHSFDIRRLHYLRFGHIDMGDIETNRSLKFLKVLSCKCRDEIETTFDAMEKELPKREMRSYIYSAFHLQKHFRNHLLKNNPAGLNPEDVDSHFLDEICRLNESRQFFRGVDEREEGGLHPYLAKYVWLYFDHTFEMENPLEGFIRDFIQRRQFHRPVASKPSITVKEACDTLGLSYEGFSAMTRKELIRHYRRKAKNMHPDRGGDHDSFVRMQEAYEVLLTIKSAK